MELTSTFRTQWSHKLCARGKALLGKRPGKDLNFGNPSPSVKEVPLNGTCYNVNIPWERNSSRGPLRTHTVGPTWLQGSSAKRDRWGLDSRGWSDSCMGGQAEYLPQGPTEDCVPSVIKTDSPIFQVFYVSITGLKLSERGCWVTLMGPFLETAWLPRWPGSPLEQHTTIPQMKHYLRD